MYVCLNLFNIGWSICVLVDRPVYSQVSCYLDVVCELKELNTAKKGFLMANVQSNKPVVLDTNTLAKLHSAFLSKGRLVTSVAGILNDLGVKDRGQAKEVASQFVAKYPLFSSVTGETLYRYQVAYNFWVADKGLSLTAFEYLASERIGQLYNIMLAMSKKESPIKLTAKTLERYALESAADKLDNILPKRKVKSDKSTFTVASDKVRYLKELKDLSGANSFEDATVWASQTLTSQAESIADKQAKIESLEAELEALKAAYAKLVKEGLKPKPATSRKRTSKDKNLTA